jgi:hypothetical protein
MSGKRATSACTARQVGPRHHLEQGVDHGVAGDVHRGGVGALGQQVVARTGGRCEVQRRDHPGDAAIELLGEGIAEVVGAQPGLDMPEGNAAVESAHRAGHDGGGVALGQHKRRRKIRQHRVEAVQDAPGQRGERLPRLHQVEIDVRRDAEDAKRLGYQLAVLASRDDDGVAPVGRAQRRDDRRHLDAFRARADDAEHRAPTSPGGAAPRAHRQRARWSMPRPSFRKGPSAAASITAGLGSYSSSMRSAT